MTREELQTLIDADNIEALQQEIADHEKIIKIGKKTYTVADMLRQYDPAHHDINDTSKYQDKIVEVDSGNEYTDSISGERKTEKEKQSVEVNRLPLSMQQKIVLIAACFLVGDKIQIESDTDSDIEKKLLNLIKKVWIDNKLDYKSRELAKLQMSETHCAELWYDYRDDDYWEDTINEGSTRRMGMMLLSESSGDKLYAVKDQYRDLIAFGRGYTVTSGKDDVEHFDLYTDGVIITSKKTQYGWEVITQKANPYKAIPVIYYDQERAEWSDVQPLIERKEEKLSKFADTNDYFDSPALVAKGDVTSLPSKGEVGKLFQIDEPTGNGDLKYLTWDQAPQSTKMEFEILDKEIHSLTHTPDISFETMKTLLGGNITGIALKMLFMDPQMKASDKQEKFLELIQRRLNLMKKIIISFNPTVLKPASGLSVAPRSRTYMPVNDVEYNQMLITAYQAGMISQRTMLELSTLVTDADKELDEIKANPPQPAPPPIQKPLAKAS